jgi:hypothetical protein
MTQPDYRLTAKGGSQGFVPIRDIRSNPENPDRHGVEAHGVWGVCGERAEPKDAQEEIYVGLEHLDPQCLHIRRWGKGSDVIGGKLRFRKGDIIFGKRRAYQRKLAVAEFGGICSAHAMVIRARPDKVLPEFLPFLMMSDRFMNRAVEISVGLMVARTQNLGGQLPPSRASLRLLLGALSFKPSIRQTPLLPAQTMSLRPR